MSSGVKAKDDGCYQWEVLDRSNDVNSASPRKTSEIWFKNSEFSSVFSFLFPKSKEPLKLTLDLREGEKKRFQRAMESNRPFQEEGL